MYYADIVKVIMPTTKGMAGNNAGLFRSVSLSLWDSTEIKGLTRVERHEIVYVIVFTYPKEIRCPA